MDSREKLEYYRTKMQDIVSTPLLITIVFESEN